MMIIKITNYFVEGEILYLIRNDTSTQLNLIRATNCTFRNKFFKLQTSLFFESNFRKYFGVFDCFLFKEKSNQNLENKDQCKVSYERSQKARTAIWCPFFRNSFIIIVNHLRDSYTNWKRQSYVQDSDSLQKTLTERYTVSYFLRDVDCRYTPYTLDINSTIFKIPINIRSLIVSLCIINNNIIR